jgi:hypothetical protein
MDIEEKSTTTQLKNCNMLKIAKVYSTTFVACNPYFTPCGDQPLDSFQSNNVSALSVS